ncbi:hypothetical protein E2K80_09205 [Rhodophyticola sp. CCM32]|uniref:bestrophin family protein n=1 Tax=Rhodophyticola sp. CCM32 TaxID=2916397 RepID=UPI00107F9BA0|nr:bestrophin family ion channel [Rhodophyticola sp. CCM32]QBY00881.1 hypothetical protein E2K80_09205 [Rhodophyticola sp. CCM32]
MIIRDKPTFVQLFFALQGSVLPRIAPRILMLTGLAAGLTWADRAAFLPLAHPSAAPFAIFGVALSMFLGFRNNAAYDRWWEGRKLWGQLIADLRALGRESEVFITAPERRIRILKAALAFLHLHRANLRHVPDDTKARDLTGEDFSSAAHPPCAALDRVGTELAAARNAGETDGFGARALAERLGSITLAQAGCERIATTPLPYVYSLLIFRTTYLYCLLLPLGLVDQAGWLTPVFVAVVAYVFLGLAEVTEELSEPFGTSVNGLPLDAMCRVVEISLAPRLGQEVPAALPPENYHLS